jgi:hypothetical protein
MSDFSSITNHHERAVFEAVLDAHFDFPDVADAVLPDVACLALNRLPPRYIRHRADLAFYLGEKERSDTERAIREAVTYAFGVVSSHSAPAR